MSTDSGNDFAANAFAAIVERSELVVIGLDSDAAISYTNKAAAAYFHCSEQDMLGKPYTDLLPTAEHGKFAKLWRKVTRGRTVPEIEIQHTAADGGTMHTLTTLFAMPSRDQTVALIAISDISSRKATELALKESSSQIQAIVQTVLDGVITIDEFGIVGAFNPAAEHIFQYKAHEIIGHNISRLMPEPDRSQHDDYLRNHLKTGETKIIGKGREVTGKRKDGTLFPMALAVSATEIDGNIAFVGVVSDISERKAVEDALRESQQRTEEANIELSTTLQELQTTQQQLVQAEKMAALGQMVAGVAHEINTPVGVGITAASQLESAASEVRDHLGSGALKKSELSRFLDNTIESSSIVLRNLERAATLINSFKQTSTDQSTDERRKFELGEYSREILNSLAPILKDHQASAILNCSEPIHMHSYPGAYAQVLTNLIRNALDHGLRDSDSGRVDIRIWRDAEHAYVQCCDNGMGIHAASLPQLFDPFFTTARSSGNTGLGLNICFNLVTQVLQGEIDVTSEPGKGACFEIQMPFDA